MAKWNTETEHGGIVGPRLQAQIGVFIKELRYCELGMHSALYVGMTIYTLTIPNHPSWGFVIAETGDRRKARRLARKFNVRFYAHR